MVRLLFLLALTVPALAGTPEAYRFGNTWVVMKRVEGMLVNRACEDCVALSKGQELGKVPVDGQLLLGGKNPFSVRCKTVMMGEVRIGRDREGNEDAFCYFAKDESYLR